MTKTKSTKSALLSSALALFLCFTMLLGTTFAWFTDSVTSSGNIIQSGTLDVTMEWKDATAAGAQQTYKDASVGAIFNYEKWEPGYVEAKNIKIGNAGTLALKYQLAIVATGEVSELSDVIDVYYAEGEYTLADRAMSELTKIGTLTEVLANMSTTANGDLLAGETDTVTLALKMQETAGNAYQGLSIGSEFAIKCFATQFTAETDSFDNQYDKMATIDNEAELLEALAADYDLITLGSNLAVTDIVTIPAGRTVTIDLAGYTIEDDASYTYAAGHDAIIVVSYGASLTVKDSVGTGAIVADNQWINGIKMTNTGETYAGEPAKLTVDGGTISSRTWYAVVGNGGRDNTEVTINGGNLIGAYAAVFNPQNGSLTINGGTLTGLTMAGESYANSGYALALYSGSLYINGGTFNGVKNVIEILNRNEGGYEPIGEIAIKGGVFNRTGVNTWDGDKNDITVDLSDYVAEGYDVIVETKGEDTYCTVVEGTVVSTLSELVSAIKSGDTVIDANGATLGDFYYDAKFTDGVTVKNAKFTYFYGGNVEGTVTFENCEFVSDHSYSANFDSGNGAIIFNNCLFDGWSSFGTAITNVEFNNCTFQKSYNYGVLRFYQTAQLNNCTFADNFEGIDTNATGYKVEFTDCTGIDGKIYNNGSNKGIWVVDGVDISDNITTW